MPCRSGDEDLYGSRGVDPQWQRDAERLKAMLCGLATALDDHNCLDNWLNKVDWKEAGVLRQTFDKWWKEHKEEDKVRRDREAAETRKKLVKQQALLKLNAEERKALGV